MFRFLAGLTVFATAWLFYYPLFLYQPVTREISQRASSLLAFLSSSAVDLSTFFPSFLKKPNNGYLPNWLWLSALAVALGLVLRPRFMARPGQAGPPCPPGPGAAADGSRLFFPPRSPADALYFGRARLLLQFQEFRPDKETGGFRIKAGQDYDLFFDLDGSASDRLDLRLLKKDGAAIRITNGTRTLLAENRNPQSRRELRMSALDSFRLGERRLVHLGLETKSPAATTFFWLQLR